MTILLCHFADLNGTGPIRHPRVIKNDTEKGMRYAHDPIPGVTHLWKSEGFNSKAEMDAWFSKAIKPGQTVGKFIMAFTLADREETP